MRLLSEYVWLVWAELVWQLDRTCDFSRQHPQAHAMYRPPSTSGTQAPVIPAVLSRRVRTAPGHWTAHSVLIVFKVVIDLVRGGLGLGHYSRVGRRRTSTDNAPPSGPDDGAS